MIKGILYFQEVSLKKSLKVDSPESPSLPSPYNNRTSCILHSVFHSLANEYFN